jgi:NitT/TauT family transport system permease protein
METLPPDLMIDEARVSDLTPHRRRRRVVVVGRIALPVAFLVLWQIAADRGIVDPLFVSKPTEVFDFLQSALAEASTWRNLWVTIQETLTGFAIATVLGVGTGLLFTRAPVLHDITRPYLTAINTLPRIALAPLFTLWFGLGQASKVALVFSLCFFIVLSATMGAIANVDPDLVRLARGLGFSPSTIYVKVMLRWAVPGIFAGIELALVYAFLGAVGAEMISSQGGVGQQIQYFSGTLNTAGVLGTLLLLAVVTTSFTLAMDAVRRRLTRYQA